jgi:hypothetical protein
MNASGTQLNEINPADLAQYGKAIVFDPQDLRTLFQDSAGTIPVTGVEQPVGRMLDKGGGSFHATQSTAASRPTLSARYNMLVGTDTLATQSVTTLATDYTLSFSGTGTVTLSGAVEVAVVLSAGVSLFTVKAGTLSLTVSGSVTNAQLVPTNQSHPQGLTYGPELVTNGTASDTSSVDSSVSPLAGFSNYNAHNATNKVTIENGAFRIIADEFNIGLLSVFSEKKTVKVECTLVSVALGGLFLALDNGTGEPPFGRPNAPGTYSWIGAGTQLRIARRSVPTDTVFDNISVREITNLNDVRLPYQSVTSATVYDSDPSKFPWYLRFTNHWMVTPSIDATAYDKVMVACGLRKMSDAARGTVIESSATIASNNGSFALTAPQSAAATLGMESKGTVLTDAIASSLAAPTTRVVAALASIAADSNIIRVNGAAADTDSGDQGTGNLGNYPLYIGERAGTSLPFNGYLYGATILFPTALPNDNLIAALERHYAAKAGIVI